MRRLVAALDRHWFEPGSLRDLAIVRIVVAGAAWYFVLPRQTGGLAMLAAADDTLYMPLPALKLLLLPFGWGARPPFELMAALLVVAHVAALFAVIGLFSRLSMGVLAVAMTAIVTYGYSYGELHHPQTLIVIMTWVLAVTPIGSALSVDAVRRRWREVRTAQVFQPAAPSSELSIHARWPLRLGQWLLVLAYLSAAASKIEGGGLAWMNGTTLAYYLAYDGLFWDRPLGVFLAQIGWLMVGLSVFTMIFEGTFAAAVLFPRVTWLYVSAGVGLHIGIYLAQKAPFFTFLALYVVFIPQLRENWLAFERWWRTRGRTAAPTPAAPTGDRLAIIYDGLCPLCIRTMAVVDVIAGSRRVEYIDLEADWPRAAARAPGLTRDAALQAMHVVTPAGRVSGGFDAFRSLTTATPVLRPLAPLLYLPAVPPLGRRIYRWVAARRPRRLCRDVCEL